METDVNLKRLFKACGQDFVLLTGDRDATVLSVDVLELQEVKRSVDCLLCLRRGTETYYRHIEFQAGNDSAMAERCFRYNSLLLLELHAPVLTTVLYLSPPGPPKGELVYRVILGGIEVNSWHFDVVRLWEIKAETALASGAPGLMVLVPLLDGGDPVAVGRAAEQIQRLAPEEQVSELEIILWLLARQRYNMEDLARGIGRNHMNALLELLRSSPAWQNPMAEVAAIARIIGEEIGEERGKAIGEAAGEAKARAELLAVERELCVEIVSRSHPELLADVSRHVEKCDDPAILREWIRTARESDGEALTRLIAGQPETPR